MELAEKFKQMAIASKDAIEDFNDFAEDRATSWAFDEITRLTTAVESLTAEKESAEREVMRKDLRISELSHSAEMEGKLAGQAGEIIALEQMLSAAESSLAQAREEIEFERKRVAMWQESSQLETIRAEEMRQFCIHCIDDPEGAMCSTVAMLEAAEQREKGLVALVGKVSDIVGQPSTCDHCEEAWEAINEFNKAALAAASKEEV